MARAVRASSRTDTVVLVTCVLASLLLTILPLGAREGVAGVLRRTVVQPVLVLQQTAERGAMRSSSVTRSRGASTA